MPLIKTPAEIKKIAAAGTILKAVLVQVAAAARPGTTLLALDELAERLIREAGAEPAFLGYKPGGAKKPYPATLCTSLDEVVVHGVPSRHSLKPGTLLKLDLGVRYRGYHADAAVTVIIGAVGDREQSLVAATRGALAAGIRAARPGNTLGDIGHAIQSHVERAGFKVVRGLTGHGIGRGLHEEPSVLNEGKLGGGMELKAGMALAIEPMVSAGSPHLRQLPDESYATRDGSQSAHFEHTVLITDRGPKILTG